MKARPFLLAAVVLLFGACMATRPQRGGASTATLGGASAPTVVSSAAPENPQTPSTTLVEKTTTRDFLATASTAPAPVAAKVAGQSAAPVLAQAAPVSPAAPVILRETVTERATTTLGSAQKDTTRELGARLANLRGVLWVGVALLIGGPLVGWKLGWFLNGCIAGGVGLLLVILSTVIPGHEAWFGLLGLGAIPVVAFVYYRAHHDAANPPPSAP